MKHSIISPAAASDRLQEGDTECCVKDPRTAAVAPQLQGVGRLQLHVDRAPALLVQRAVRSASVVERDLQALVNIFSVMSDINSEGRMSRMMCRHQSPAHLEFIESETTNNKIGFTS